MSTEATSAFQPRVAFDVLAPLVFVLFWSTGFIGAKLGLPYAEPFTFLLLRFVVAAVVLGAIAVVLRAPWPRDLRTVGHSAVVGVLLQSMYLGGVFSAIRQGMPAGIASLIVGLQPLVTAVLGQLLLRERVTPRQWLGLLLGLVGVALVLGAPLLAGGVGRVALTAPAVGMAVLALLAATGGTLYQRHYGRAIPLLSGTTIQFVAAAGVMAVAAPLFETMHVQWTPAFGFALGWLVIVLSIGAILLLMVLLQRRTTTSVASLFYLVPPATAIEAFVLFDERLAPLALVGMVIAVVGVGLVVMRPRARL